MTTTRKSKGRRKKRRKRQANRSAALLILFLCLLLLFLLLLFRALFQGGEPEPSHVEETEPSVTETLPPSTLTAECFGWENGYRTYQSPDATALLGVDVSSYQEEIDWQAVAESGVRFAILRAGFRGYGDGSTRQDDYFAYNLEQAAANGLDVGVYFFSQALNEEEARAEAYAVLSMVSGYNIQYPIFFDWEPITDDEARTDTISASELTACAKAFCSVVEQAGYRAGVYFNLSMAAHYYHLYELRDYVFWLAEYQEIPSFPFAFSMWQYTSEGTVPGIGPHVDLDLCFTPS